MKLMCISWFHCSAQLKSVRSKTLSDHSVFLFGNCALIRWFDSDIFECMVCHIQLRRTYLLTEIFLFIKVHETRSKYELPMRITWPQFKRKNIINKLWEMRQIVWIWEENRYVWLNTEWVILSIKTTRLYKSSIFSKQSMIQADTISLCQKSCVHSNTFLTFMLSSMQGSKNQSLHQIDELRLIQFRSKLILL